ncbi:MAG: type II toxin-antitoxin system prevent-host-death family antitoxin [Betaproteobacteria bacterium]|nr:type II toxin-antitoxin system prevent-host-death family antitoxin [Betaproteobacteria bacterium]
MSQSLTATHLRAELFKTLDRVATTGEPIEVTRPAGKVRIVAAASGNRLARLVPHPGTVTGDAADLANRGWESAWQPVL